jgi:predicted transcriptional regulator
MPATKPRKPTIKAEAARIVRQLPTSASWDDVMYQFYVRQKIDNGLADIKAGRVHSHASVLKEFGLGK